MGFFGKSEAELKQIAAELTKRQTELDNRESTLESKQSSIQHEKVLLDEAKAHFDAERESFRKTTKTEREDITSENAALENRRVELTKVEAEAGTAFVERQREAFREIIEKRLAELDGRQDELERATEQLSVRYKELHTAEAEVAKRELAVTEREQKADAGFADKSKTLANEAAHQHQANQAEAERLRKLATTLAEERQQVETVKAQLVSREQVIIVAEQKRDAGFADERASLDAELRNQRSKVEAELTSYRDQRLTAIEQEVANLKTRRLEEIARAENAERERIRGEIEAERESWTSQHEAARKKLDTERAELERHKGGVCSLQAEMEGLKVELETSERVLERKAQRLEGQWQKRNDDLTEEIDSRLDEERKSMKSERQTLRDENVRLRESLRLQMELVGAFDQLKQQLGDRDPADILHEINSKTDEFIRLREELDTDRTEEMRKRLQEMQAELQRNKARVEQLTKQISDNAALTADANELRRRNSELDADNRMLAQKAERLEGAANEAQLELKRLLAAYERPADVAARYMEIELPHIPASKARQPKKDDTVDEITWLKGIGTACDAYGLHFHPRILKAFHTSLKTAEWSPLTILAGVSGTGKSELPRLYSHFGGLMFEPLSVQPNWDSQESMLGFFNSIDNKFDAQPVLRFLAQCQQVGNEPYEKRIARWQKMADTLLNLDPEKQKELIQALKESDYPGLQDCVCMILLDEMNLAHPELYLAEFLSKLELRRGMKGSDVPFLPVKIGAGLPPYQLPLGRNVLWTGTMNQDETTKALSDKVLDRSIVIHFPRPTELKRRLKLSSLDEKNRGTLLHKVTWQSWLAQGSSFRGDDVKPYKAFIEGMNNSLAVAGRAIGHRVWQSVEYYMVNYPDVRAAQADFIKALRQAHKEENDIEIDHALQPVEYYMDKYPKVRTAHESIDKEQLAKALHVAFEDQLVQKIMPKLRGIDTRARGKSMTECLEKIRDQINAGIDGKPFHLEEDFNLACELGYGQFIWQSANYLRNSEAENGQPADESGSQAGNTDLSQPPIDYHPESPDRHEKWSKLQPKQKRLFYLQSQKPKRAES